VTTIDLTDDAPAHQWWRALALWTLGVFLYASVLWMQIGLPFVISLESAAVYVYSLGLLTIPVRRWSWRAMARATPTPALIARHVAFGLITMAAWLGTNLLHDRLAVGPHFWDIIYKASWLFQLLFALTVYGTVMGVTLTAQSWRRERERERREAELTILAREAELGAIRAQFQPHFVLNALNSLLALIDRDPALARTMVVRLADVMKAVFERVDLPAVPLHRELDLVQAYLDVERIRFGSRLSVTFQVDDNARHVMVPPFLLQPIVENAVKHGIAPFARDGDVRIEAHVADGRLHVTVRDTGEHAASPATAGTGVGLQLTRRRLGTTFGTAYELTLDRHSTGTAVRIVMPVEVPHAV